MKTITIQIPDNCEIQIIEKEEKKEKKKEPVIKTYQDLIDNSIELEGFYVTSQSDISRVHGLALKRNELIAASEKVAKSMLAMAQISQLMPYYGGEVIKEEWEDEHIDKFIIYKAENIIKTWKVVTAYYFLAFHTEKQRNEFLKYNEQLVKDYLMID